MNNAFPPTHLLHKIRTHTGEWGDTFCTLLKTVFETSQSILKVRNHGLQTLQKPDGSPVTNADKIAQEIILKDIHALPTPFSKITIVSEELPPLPKASPQGDFWLIDPLDGTKGFIKGRPEFCINIALLRNGKTIFGLVGVPDRHLIYLAAEGTGAWKINIKTASFEQIHCRKLTAETLAQEGLRVVASTRPNSRSLLYKHLEKNCGNPKISTIQEMGSAVKILEIAEGNADYYYQPGPTMAWDISAPQIILEEAGGIIRKLDGHRLSYGKDDWKNSIFEVIGTSETLLD
ncbi:3'(2'),5'-bisphosphate nucleotidase CysQ [Acetobacteraceae bacterium]|nr:3'(2'),5'-bisphosphate nucleotidase CysQ [Acetobacteraceae bacterium]